MVRTQHDISKDLVVRHLNVADINTQAKNLLQLKLDSRPYLVELVVEVLNVRDGSGELASYIIHVSPKLGFCERERNSMHTLGETGTEQTRDLLEEGFRGQERVVLLRELLDEFLIFVQPKVGGMR